MYTLIQTPGGEGAAARLCLISIVLALVSLLISEWLARLRPRADREITMLELHFTQTLGNHCLSINETLPASGITAVFGVSGAGKTSLINAISGLTRPQKGRIVLNGRVLNDTEKTHLPGPGKAAGGLCISGRAPVSAL
ncbi:Molybdenum transport system permease protein modB [Raoultella planticola]|uniref:Molybdenum transport system permease protein modB n=1 Tax=Raoultella planticola TaxID=575 RepID=A0A485AUH9_RAOPL|nr:Molybdenum transport system permease protein modB [Raoultella planticola]